MAIVDSFLIDLTPPKRDVGTDAASQGSLDSRPLLEIAGTDPGNQSAGSDDEENFRPSLDDQQIRRSAQRATFNDYLKRKASLPDSNLSESLEASKLNGETSSKVIDKARDYQQELFERAKSENVIAVLDTGSGKTLIACLLIKHILADELTIRSNGDRPRIVFFLANSVHLVQQQARVLNSNLVTSCFVFCGNDHVERWRRRSCWEEILDEMRPVVCTPAILQRCLDMGVLSIEEISLLVFDEAHHAKKNHPYSTIMRSYYIPCPADRRPKIFGMTASPVDSKGNIETNSADLEQLLHSRIATASDMSIMSFAPKPRDVVWKYAKPGHASETELCLRIAHSGDFLKEAKRGFTFARYAMSELGSWCADQVWAYVFGYTEHDLGSAIKRYEQSEDYTKLATVEEREARLRSIEETFTLVRQYNLNTPSPDGANLSPKVTQLWHELLARYAVHPETRTIVFVEQRLTAQVLRDCFRMLRIPNMRPDVLVGNSSESPSLKKQEAVLDHFRAGLVNLIFATSVADEGIDIPQCNLCVRFDLYKSPIQYIQSRGRARVADSIYVHCIEENSSSQEAAVQYAIDSDVYIKRFCQSLPPDRLLGRGTRLDRMIKQDSANTSFKTSSGATCDFGNALLIVNQFASSLAHVGALTKETYEEEINEEHREFRFVVRLPPNSETQVKGAVGDWRQNKQLAKRSAAWKCCWSLRRKGLLDEALHSVFQKVKPANLNARLAVSAKQSSYQMQIKPSIWSRNLGEIPARLYACVLSFSPEMPLGRQLQSLVILTRERLPQFPTFPIYIEDNIQTTVHLTRLDNGYDVSTEDVQLLTIYTLAGVFFDVFNKVYEIDATAIGYWLAPVRSETVVSMESANLCDLVDMTAIREVQRGRLRWSPGSPVQEVWTNQFICDPRNGKFHYFSGNIAPGKTIFDPVPETVPQIQQKGRKNIIDFSDSFWKASKRNFAAATYDENQPIMNAELMMSRRNFLDPGTEKERQQTMCLIAPQPLEVSRLGPQVAATCLLWPAILHRLDSYLITMEGFSKIGLHNVPLELTLEAFTKDGDTDASDDQIHFARQRGMGRNYERLEFIGDSLLKMMTTITVFLRTKCDEEGMHCRRMEILCNRRLFDVATERHQLYHFIRATTFNRDTWYPENLVLLKGRGAKKPPVPVKHGSKTQDLGMKTIADVSEAIIGAAVTTSRHLPTSIKFDMGIQAITTLVNSPDHDLQGWADIATMYSPPEWTLLTNDVQANRLADEIYKKTEYRFRHPRLLRSAFTHSSDTNATVPDLQRLEFLGDAVLDWVCISWLYDSNPTRNPQWLTEHKMAMVSNKFLAALAVTLHFDKHVYCNTTRLYADITSYSAQVRDRTSIPGYSRDFWTDIPSPPKALSDLVESYLGAVLVDSNFDYVEIEKFFNKHVLPFFEDITQYDGFASHHPTSYLYKRFTNDFQCRDFHVMASELEEGQIDEVITAGVLIHGEVIVSAKASNAKIAKVKASRLLLAEVEGMTMDKFKEVYKCDCSRKI